MLYHLTTATDWEALRGPESFAPASLDTDGFVHLSDASQVAATAQRFFGGLEDVMLLEIDEIAVKAELRWEDLYGHGSFPHLYGPVNLDAIVRAASYDPERVL